MPIQKLAQQEFTLQDLETRFYEDEQGVLQRLEYFGIVAGDIGNYIDLATVLYIDDRLLSNVAIEEYSDLLQALVDQAIEKEGD